MVTRSRSKLGEFFTPSTCRSRDILHYLRTFCKDFGQKLLFRSVFHALFRVWLHGNFFRVWNIQGKTWKFSSIYLYLLDPNSASIRHYHGAKAIIWPYLCIFDYTVHRFFLTLTSFVMRKYHGTQVNGLFLQ